MFYLPLIQGFREKLTASSTGMLQECCSATILMVLVQSTTPTSTPPPEAILTHLPANATADTTMQAPAQSTSSILASLQALAAASKPASTPAPAVSLPPAGSYPPQAQAPVVAQAVPVPPVVPTVAYGAINPPAPPPNMFNHSSNTTAPLPTFPQGDAAMQQQIQILQVLQAQGVPQDQWATVLAAVMAAQNGSAVPPPAPPAQVTNGYAATAQTNVPNVRRSRSRSPRGNRAPMSPRRRSPVRNEQDRGRNGAYNSHRGSPAAQHNNGLPPPGPKWIEYDVSVPANHIKVYSRTLFVGGVTCNEHELRDLISGTGVVQTCIVSPHKRHAFVKVSHLDSILP